MGVLKAWDSVAGAWMPVAGQDSYPISRTLIDAKGDLIVGSAADTAAKLTAGSNGFVVMAASGEATGLQYGPIKQTYEPALTAVTTNPTLGSGSAAVGAYWRIGNLIFANITIKFGSSGVNAGSGNYAVSLPVAAAASTSSATNFLLGTCAMRDDSTANYAENSVMYGTSTTVVFRGASPNVVTHSTPWAWAALDSIHLNLCYEAA